MTVTGQKGSDEHNPMPSNPAGWFFEYGLSLYISEGYVIYSKYSILWLYWGILREEQKLKCTDYVVMIEMKHRSIDKLCGIRAVPGSWKSSVKLQLRESVQNYCRCCQSWVECVAQWHSCFPRMKWHKFSSSFLCGLCCKYQQKKEKNHYWRKGAFSLSI